MRGSVVRFAIASAIVVGVGSVAHARGTYESFDLVTSGASGSRVSWRIDRPNPRAPATSYPQISLRAGDRVTIEAGGCVQTGGHGKTWKRWVDPLGRKADKQYSALIDIPGTTLGMQRLQLWLGRPTTIARNTTLRLGYQDDDYRDNGYWGHDDGNRGQCRDVGPAWVVLHVDPAESSESPVEGKPRYNEIVQASAHNAYASSKPTLSKQLETGKLRSLELDIHHSRMGKQAPSDDFFVYHDAVLSPGSSCATLASCLAEIATWHASHPEHEATTVFVDLKDRWVRGHSASSLEHQLATHLPNLLASPSDLVATCAGTSTMRQALRTCGWPKTDALRGKFIFVLTGDSKQLDAYAGSDATASRRTAFIAPRIEREDEIASRTNAVFFNLDSDHFTLGRAVFAQGFISRVFYRSLIDVRGINDAKNWRIAANNHIHHIATDMLGTRARSFAVTANAHGWPFACLLQDCSTMVEP